MALTDDAFAMARPGAQLEVMPGGTLGGAAAPPSRPDEPAGDPASIWEESAELEPGLGDLEAAVGLVSADLATRVVLTGFPSWPGLLWHAYRLAESANVLILPTVVCPGGRVDIVITRDQSASG